MAEITENPLFETITGIVFVFPYDEEKCMKFFEYCTDYTIFKKIKEDTGYTLTEAFEDFFHRYYGIKFTCVFFQGELNLMFEKRLYSAYSAKEKSFASLEDLRTFVGNVLQPITPKITVMQQAGFTNCLLIDITALRYNLDFVVNIARNNNFCGLTGKDLEYLCDEDLEDLINKACDGDTDYLPYLLKVAALNKCTKFKIYVSGKETYAGALGEYPWEDNFVFHTFHADDFIMFSDKLLSTSDYSFSILNSYIKERKVRECLPM